MSVLLTRFLLASLLVAHGLPYKIPFGSIHPLGTRAAGNFCTAFSINEREGYWATNEHCTDGETDILIGGEPAQVIHEDSSADIAVLRGQRTTALRVASVTPAPQTPIYKYGFGNGWHTGWDSSGRMSGWIVRGAFLGHLLLVLDLPLAPGDSGSPVMTYDNTVVSIAELYFISGQRVMLQSHGVRDPSGGMTTEVMYEVLRPYLPETPRNDEAH